MILQSLNQLYQRLAADDRYGVPTPGYGVQKITFCIVVRPDGALHDIEDARQTFTKTTKAGKTRTAQIARRMLVPGEGERSGQGFSPRTLSDNTAYLLGYAADAGKQARAARCFYASREHHLELETNINDASFSAVCSFLKSWTPEAAVEWKAKLDDFAATGFGVFQLLDQREFVHETAAFRNWWLSQQDSPPTDEIVAPCLVTGKSLPIARLAEPAIKGVNGAAPKGAMLASFNQKAFESYGKEQTYNAPVSKVATFQYCNALNALLSGPQSHRHRIQIGDATTVFWTERETVTESLFAEFLGGNIEAEEKTAATEEDQVVHQRIDTFLKILRRGGGAQVSDLGDDPQTRFYILGLSGNVTRLAVRFWHVGSIAQTVDRLKAHYDALRVVRSRETDPEFAPVWMLLDEVVPLKKGKPDRDRLPPNLAADVMMSILNGSAYPLSLLHLVLRRVRISERLSETRLRDRISYRRVAILQCFLNRNYRKNMNEALDPNRPEAAYHLGRLFAVYETAQRHAHDWKLERTIRETMYSSASATPLAVFGRLERLFHHHTREKKYPPGSSKSYSDIVGEICQNFRSQPPYPASLNLVDQSLFAVGYYHQMHALRSLSNKATKPDLQSLT